MSDSDIFSSLKEIIDSSFNPDVLSHLLDQVNAKASDLKALDSQARDTFYNALDERLQALHYEPSETGSLEAIQSFVELLYHLQPILCPTLLITNWFDTVLRPALREQSLPFVTLDHAKELVVLALVEGRTSDTTRSFRIRVLDHYLEDGSNAVSQEDIIDWSSHVEGESWKRNYWGGNLEDVLIRCCSRRPTSLLSCLSQAFKNPSYRAQLAYLFNKIISTLGSHEMEFISDPTFHELLSDILFSLQVDTASTSCEYGLSFLVKLVATMANKCPDKLRARAPTLFAILGRFICWNYRVSQIFDVHEDSQQTTPSSQLSKSLAEKERLLSTKKLRVRDGINWALPNSSFHLSEFRIYELFVILYYLFPHNLLEFLRRPSEYLQAANVKSPYTVGWHEVLNETQIKSIGEKLFQKHLVNTRLLVYDAFAELHQDSPWTEYEPARILAESLMLRAHVPVQSIFQSSKRPFPPSLISDETKTPVPKHRELTGQTEPHVLSLQEILRYTTILKSGEDFQMMDSSPSWLSEFFNPARSSSSELDIPLPSSADQEESSQPSGSSADPETSAPASRAISNLQRQILLLRNEHNLELWLKRETARHLNRLYENQAMTRLGELERQGLNNKLHELRDQLSKARDELRKRDEETRSKRETYTDWDQQQRSKLNALREQRKIWEAETSELRAYKKDAEIRLNAQSKLLADAQGKVFTLETDLKEEAPKVARLHDYEKRIEQLTSMQRLWGDDIKLLNEQSHQMALMASNDQKMKLQVESYERAQQILDSTARHSQNKIVSLERQLRILQHNADSYRKNTDEILAARTADVQKLTRDQTALMDENQKLRQEIQNLKLKMERDQEEFRQGKSKTSLS